MTDPILWELLEMEAPEKFYVGNKEHPAFLLFPRWHWASTKSHHSLYLNSVGLIDQFTSQKKALARLKEIVENANVPINVYQVSKYGRKRGKRILFAKNDIQRVPLEPEKVVEGTFVKVFNIDEWKEVG